MISRGAFLSAIEKTEQHILKTCRFIWFLALILVGIFTVYADRFYIESGGELAGSQGVNSQWSLLIYVTGFIYFLVGILGLDIYKRSLSSHILAGHLSFLKGLQRLALSQIIKYSLFEACAVNGLVLAVLSQDIRASYPFIILAVVGFFIHFPMYDRMFDGFPQWQEPEQMP